jgi:hypothetical protein
MRAATRQLEAAGLIRLHQRGPGKAPEIELLMPDQSQATEA